MKKLLAPTIGKVLLSLFFLGYHILYVLELLTLDSIRGYLTYFPIGLSLIDWGNYFLMKLSFVALWIVIALVIFTLLWSKELFSALVKNSKIKKSYVGQPRENYEHLLKVKPFTIKDHIFPKMILAAVYIVVALITFYGVAVVENFRFTTLNLLFIDLFSSGHEVDLSSVYYLIASFAWTYPLWYILSTFVVWVHGFGKSKEKEEEIVEAHFAVPVD